MIWTGPRPRKSGVRRTPRCSATCFTDFGAWQLEHLESMLTRAADLSFNSISIDGDTSTNDTVLLLASGQSGVTAQLDHVPGFRGRARPCLLAGASPTPSLTMAKASPTSIHARSRYRRAHKRRSEDRSLPLHCALTACAKPALVLRRSQLGPPARRRRATRAWPSTPAIR